MAKPNLEYRIEVDNREMVKKFTTATRMTEDFDSALRNLVKDIKIGIRVVPIKKKKWYQFWK